jgi:hypothetical protein
VRPPGKHLRELQEFSKASTLEPPRTNAEVLQDLADFAFNNEKEKYYAISDSPSGPDVTSGVSVFRGTVGNAISPPSDGSMHTMVHCHDIGRIPMFSAEDLFSFKRLYLNRATRESSWDVNVTFILTTHTNQHYALKVENKDKFLVFMDLFDQIKYKNELEKLNGKSDQRLAEFFGNFMSGSGISLYSMSNIGNNVWKQL